MCSGGHPFRIQVSPSTADRLRSEHFAHLVPRGPTFFKGKGLICTSWLSDQALETEITNQRHNSANPAMIAPFTVTIRDEHATSDVPIVMHITGMSESLSTSLTGCRDPR